MHRIELTTGKWLTREQKTEINVEHFRKVTSKKINGQAKAMVITASRLHAIRDKLAFNAYLILRKKVIRI